MRFGILEFGISSLIFHVWYLEFGVWGLDFDFRVWPSEFRSFGLRVRCFGFVFGVWSSWLKILSLEFLDSYFGLGISILRLVFVGCNFEVCDMVFVDLEFLFGV